jgi:hypothetical protein
MAEKPPVEFQDFEDGEGQGVSTRLPRGEVGGEEVEFEWAASAAGFWCERALSEGLPAC